VVIAKESNKDATRQRPTTSIYRRNGGETLDIDLVATVEGID